MSRWLAKALTRIHQCAAERSIRLTGKAVRELGALGLGLDPEDVRDVLRALTAADSAGRLVAEATGEWMYLFTVHLGEVPVYVKLVLRTDCVVVSFHEDQGDDHEEQA